MAWEPGDDICPPWPWPWPGPRPPWWDAKVARVSEEIFTGLTLINIAGRITDLRTSLTVARAGAELVTRHAPELGQLMSQAKG